MEQGDARHLAVNTNVLTSPWLHRAWACAARYGTAGVASVSFTILAPELPPIEMVSETRCMTEASAGQAAWLTLVSRPRRRRCGPIRYHPGHA
ncbi:hypothetical protein G6F60_015357 [Rhizopus arrhizus]|nr:hypothetical protein G6F60_015357 [Rhizopus arrhizus]